MVVAGDVLPAVDFSWFGQTDPGGSSKMNKVRLSCTASLLDELHHEQQHHFAECGEVVGGTRVEVEVHPIATCHYENYDMMM